MRLVLFDLFGTLVRMERDTKPFLKLARRCKTESPRDLIVTSLISHCPTLYEFAEMIGLEAQPDMAELEDNLQYDIESAVVFDDVFPVLDTLKTEKIKMILVSNLATPYKKVVESCDLKKYFDHLIFSCDCGLKKPDLRIYSHALRKIPISPKESLMIGDTYVADVEAPKKLGIDAYQIVRNRQKKPQTANITSLHEILSLKNCREINL